jgi:hypothetical protein
LKTSQVKNSVDIGCNSPQYLGVALLFLPQLGNDADSRDSPRGKIVHGGKLNASKEKGCQEKEALTWVIRFESEKPLERSTSQEVFLSLVETLRKVWLKMRVVLDARSC